MKRISTRAAFVLGAALVIAAASVGIGAQGPGGPGGRGRIGGPGGPGGPMGRGGPAAAIDLPLQQLNLSAQQRDQVKTILDSHQDEMKALGDRQMAARQALDAAITADAIDEGAIRQKAADLGVVEADMAIARAHLRAEVWQILTPDQQKQAKTLGTERPRPGRGR